MGYILHTKFEIQSYARDNRAKTLRIGGAPVKHRNLEKKDMKFYL